MLKNLFRKLFLVKEIASKTGVLHFQRYRLLDIEDVIRVYVHRISASDEDAHLHGHPWDFKSLILKGSYTEVSTSSENPEASTRTFQAGDIVEHSYQDYHKITLNTPVVWSLVVASGTYRLWGYDVDGRFMAHDSYRLWKNGKLSYMPAYPG